jgi:hypothetical protein
LAGIAQQVAATNPPRANELFEQAVTLAGTIPNDWLRTRALARIAGVGANTALWISAAQWRRVSLTPLISIAFEFVNALGATVDTSFEVNAIEALVRPIVDFASASSQ